MRRSQFHRPEIKVAAVCLLVLAGCNGESSAPATPAAAPTPVSVEAGNKKSGKPAKKLQTAAPSSPDMGLSK